MDSSPSLPQLVPKGLQNSIFPGGKCSSSGRRTPSSSSSSSFSSYFLDESSSPLSPATPLRMISSVPFSWEKLPGIPKKQASKKFDNDSSSNPLLPLPPSKPASNCHVFRENGNKKMVKNQQADPFFAALVECSKQDQDQEGGYCSTNNNNIIIWSNKVSRTLSHRLGLVNLSCKNTCAVSESIIYLPRSSRTPSSYDLINRRSHRNYQR